MLQCRLACSKECFSILRKRYPTPGELERGKNISRAWKNITPEKKEHFLQKCKKRGLSQWEDVDEETRNKWLDSLEQARKSLDELQASSEYKERHSKKSSEGTKLAWELDKENMIRKTVETKRKNGTFKATSKPEEALYQKLLERFDADDIERWVPINKWSIDFYIKSVDTYVQLDGVYWHGLDKSIDFLKENDTQRYKWYLKDRQQDKYFSEHNLKLIRITDKQFEANETLIFDMMSNSLLMKLVSTT